MDKRTGRFAALAVLAGVVGYVTGILTAPKSGKDTRKDIKDAAQARITEIEKRLKKAHTELNKHIAATTKKAKTMRGNAKKEADTWVEKATAAKEKVRVALSSVRDGEADDKDLQKAIDEAEKAIEHLKQYIVKK